MSDQVREAVASWLESVVVGLNLCPFAAPVLRADGVRISVGEGETAEAKRAPTRKATPRKAVDDPIHHPRTGMRRSAIAANNPVKTGMIAIISAACEVVVSA